MNPYELSDGNVVDKVQQNSMEDFYRILQYYMPPDYLHNFIAANPPDIGDIRDIAEDDQAKNSEWYGKLSVPYLVQALSTGKDQVTKKLNARKAQAVMKQSTSTSDVFKDQAARLYSHEWQKKSFLSCPNSLQINRQMLHPTMLLLKQMLKSESLKLKKA